MIYLTDKYDKDGKISFPPGTPEYYEVLQWLFFMNAGLGPMVSLPHLSLGHASRRGSRECMDSFQANV